MLLPAYLLTRSDKEASQKDSASEIQKALEDPHHPRHKEVTAILKAAQENAVKKENASSQSQSLDR